MAVKYGRVRAICAMRELCSLGLRLECVAWRPGRGAALPVELAATTWRVSLSRTPLLINHRSKLVFRATPLPPESVGPAKRSGARSSHRVVPWSRLRAWAPGGHSCSPALPCSQPSTYYASRRSSPCRGHLGRSSHSCHHLRLLLCRRRRRRRHRRPPRRHR